MFQFDKGRSVATTQDGNSIEYRQLQSFSMDFKVNLKDLYGRGQDAIYIASGKRSVDIKGEFAEITSDSINLLLNGTKSAGVVKMIDPAPVLAVPSSSPYTASLGTIPDSGTFNKLLVVYDVTNPSLAIPMTKITSGTPTTGQFLFAQSTVAGAMTYTVTTNFAADDTITVGGVTLTAKTSGATGLQFNVGTTIADTVTNIQTVLAANATVNAIYTVAKLNATFTLTETTAGDGHTPIAATYTGTGVVSSGTVTASQAINTFTFAAADAGHNVQVIYNYNMDTGSTITIKNNLMGSQKPYQLEFFSQLAGVQLHVVFPRVMAAGTSLNAKMEDFMLPSLEAKAMSTSADILGYLYLDDATAQ
ncbi:hypothetical protein Ga0466249_002294 [Sporomusaceae bacterium BoRhaA]|uniref:hypothetical protein n=1 Tax=Pelorhabdus rhamnosifermentans TaxID=2772457 RepID=UPI001C061723|nr:hypothetical protein [Pelorhabdus rhamnosifermentans]MBU2701180.1 hypothetical protein [Pelorhabdus rhamnosifermentans]